MNRMTATPPAEASVSPAAPAIALNDLTMRFGAGTESLVLAGTR